MYIFEDEDFDITSLDYNSYNILNPNELIDNIMRIYDNEIRGYTNECVNKLKNNAIKLFTIKIYKKRFYNKILSKYKNFLSILCY